jgi:hypothetical protein
MKLSNVIAGIKIPDNRKPAALAATWIVSLAIAAGSSQASARDFVEPASQVTQGSESAQDDYFHTGAGARYLRRADGEIVTETLRGNISVLMGSGGNIVVLSGKEGKFLVDAHCRPE